MSVRESLDSLIQQAINSHPSRHHSLSLSAAAALAAIACEVAQEYEVPIVFSLVDTTGQQRWFFSMDDALLVSHRLATEKAWTAVALRMATHGLAQQVRPGASLEGLPQQGICCLGGGLPCWSQTRLLGGIGISGGSVAQDIAIARESLARFSQAHFLLTPSRP